MYIEIVPNRNSPPTILLRESHRVGSKVIKKTIVNMTKWPAAIVEGLGHLLKGKTLLPAEDVFQVQYGLPHGHVEVILGMIKKLGVDKLLSSKQCRQQQLILALIAERLIYPCSKLATTRLWHTTTLASELGVEQADEDDLYEALDWLLERQERIELQLAKKHLKNETLVLYDVSSSYYEGRTCPLAAFGHNRDGKKGKKIIVYGLLTDEQGRPIAINVYPGNTADPSTVCDQVEKVRNRFGLEKVVIVGDRGMLTQARIDVIKEEPGIGWISALRSESIKKLIAQQYLQLSIFDKQNLARIESPDYPGEQLVACYNPLLAEERRRKRGELLEATEAHLIKIYNQVAQRSKKLLTKAEIGIKVGKVIGQYKMAKHFIIAIDDNVISWHRNEESISEEELLDGIYVVRTSECPERLSAEDTVRAYKGLSRVEQAFRCMKGFDSLIRPIRHWNENRVRAHIFLCALAYYVQWHMRQALAPLLFEEEDIETNRKTRDAVAPAKPSEHTLNKKSTKKTEDGFTVHSFETLLQQMGTRAKNWYRTCSVKNGPLFTQTSPPSAFHKKVFDLLGIVPSK